MKIVFALTFWFLLSACGSHWQQLTRVESKQPVKEVGETDQKLILLNAVNSGDLGVVRDWAEAGVDLNFRNNEGLTLVMVAIRAQQFAVLEYLITQNVNLELLTEGEAIAPPQNARQYLEGLGMNAEVYKILNQILNQEPFDPQVLAEFMFSAITFTNVDLMGWLLSKNVDPNHIRLSSSGRPKDTALIHLFSQRGVEGEAFARLQEIFNLLVSHPDIDVNLEVKRNTALKKAQRRLQSDPAYQPMVDRLIELGARE